jgi:hypothetical protein
VRGCRLIWWILCLIAKHTKLSCTPKFPQRINWKFISKIYRRKKKKNLIVQTATMWPLHMVSENRVNDHLKRTPWPGKMLQVSHGFTWWSYLTIDTAYINWTCSKAMKSCLSFHLNEMTVFCSCHHEINGDLHLLNHVDNLFSELLCALFYIKIFKVLWIICLIEVHFLRSSSYFGNTAVHHWYNVAYLLQTYFFMIVGGQGLGISVVYKRNIAKSQIRPPPAPSLRGFAPQICNVFLHTMIP